jgi:hypothetical protein
LTIKATPSSSCTSDLATNDCSRIDTFNFIQHKLQQLISLNRAQEMGKEVLDGLAEKSGEAYEKDS